MINDKKINAFTQIKNEEQIVIIGESFDIKGDLSGTGAAIISGKIEGNVSANQVVVEKGGSVIGNIICQELDISGYIRGSIEGSDIVIRENATIEGDLSYLTLTIENGGVVTGKLKRVNAKPAKAIAGDSKSPPPQGVQSQNLTRIVFPVDLSQKLRTHPGWMSAHLTLIDGAPIPSWINLNQDKLGLIVDSAQLQELEASGLKIKMRLHVGSQFFDFNLPT